MKIRILMLLVVMAIFAVPSFAQYQVIEPVGDETGGGGGWSGDYSFNQGYYLDNPCTSAYDAVFVDYAAYVEGAQAEAGIDRYLLSEDTTMGGSYTAAGSSLSDVAYSTPFTLRKYHKVNTYDNFHVVTVIDFDPSTRYTTVNVETACGNGMPESAQ